MQTILGSGGAIGVELSKELLKFTKEIRLVSRAPEKINGDEELLALDLTSRENVLKAIKGAEIAYVTIGFPYKLKTWQDLWPPFIDHVIDACEQENCKLVFFDNVYMYDQTAIPHMTEESPINPPSKKGQVRQQIADKIMDAHRNGRIQAVIARSADFYGPNIEQTSMLNETVIQPLKDGKTANWLSGLDFTHSFTFTPDAGRAVALLGNTPDSYGEVWHLPTAGNPPTGKQWVEMISKELKVKAKVQKLPRWMVKLIGLFIPIMREIPEMMYQYDRDYQFDSSKFEKRFDFKPTPYEVGIKEVL